MARSSSNNVTVTRRQALVLADLAAREHNRLLVNKLRRGERQSERAMELADLAAIVGALRGESELQKPPTEATDASS